MIKLNWTYLGIFLGTAGLLNVTTLGAVAEDVVGNDGIRFKEDTIVELEFIESHGAYQSVFGVVNLDSCQTNASGQINLDTCSKTPLLSEVKASDSFDTVHRSSTYETDLQAGRNNDFLGTPGNTVPNYQTEFLFEANKRYAFYLESQFDGKPAGTVYTTDFSLLNGGLLINLDDTGSTLVKDVNEDTDFDDFVVGIGGGYGCN